MYRILIVLSLILVSACGKGPGPTDGMGIRNRSILTADEIDLEKAAAWTAYDVIARLRPEFFRSRGASSLQSIAPATAVVYVDEMRFGELDALKSMSAHQIFRVQYINAADATTRFGTDHLGGAILITTR